MVAPSFVKVALFQTDVSLPAAPVVAEALNEESAVTAVAFVVTSAERASPAAPRMTGEKPVPSGGVSSVSSEKWGG